MGVVIIFMAMLTVIFFIGLLALAAIVASCSAVMKENQANSFMEEVDENHWHDETVGR